LFLGPGNGVTDGSLPIIAVFITMGFIGNDWITMKVYNDITANQVMCMVLLIGNILMNISCIYNVLKHQKKVLGPNDITGEKFVAKNFIMQIVGYFLP
jgi:hypothetical protein